MSDKLGPIDHTSDANYVGAKKFSQMAPQFEERSERMSDTCDNCQPDTYGAVHLCEKHRMPAAPQSDQPAQGEPTSESVTRWVWARFAGMPAVEPYDKEYQALFAEIEKLQRAWFTKGLHEGKNQMAALATGAKQGNPLADQWRHKARRLVVNYPPDDQSSGMAKVLNRCADELDAESLAATASQPAQHWHYCASCGERYAAGVTCDLCPPAAPQSDQPAQGERISVRGKLYDALSKTLPSLATAVQLSEFLDPYVSQWIANARQAAPASQPSAACASEWADP